MNLEQQKHPNFEEQRTSKRFNPDFLTRFRIFFNPNHFTPNDKRATEYLNLDRSNSTFDPDTKIPLGRKDYIRYSGHERGGTNDRPLGNYQLFLFPDQYESSAKPQDGGWSAERMLEESDKKENPQPIFGGYQEAFKEGKTVLDIAAGQALALLQLSERFPETSFVGLDTLYDQKRKIFPEKPGVQLTKGDWRIMEMIPDNSIDTILSLQGIGMWGLPVSFHTEVKKEDGERIIKALDRISKPGCLIRIDASGEHLNYLRKNMDPEIWEMDKTSDRVFMARKKDLNTQG